MYFLLHAHDVFLQAVTSILSPDEIATLEDQFNAMDRDKDGALSLSEIHEVGELAFLSRTCMFW